jgi:hypothetical protein
MREIFKYGSVRGIVPLRNIGNNNKLNKKEG